MEVDGPSVVRTALESAVARRGPAGAAGPVQRCDGVHWTMTELGPCDRRAVRVLAYVVDVACKC